MLPERAFDLGWNIHALSRGGVVCAGVAIEVLSCAAERDGRRLVKDRDDEEVFFHVGQRGAEGEEGGGTCVQFEGPEDSGCRKHCIPGKICLEGMPQHRNVCNQRRQSPAIPHTSAAATTSWRDLISVNRCLTLMSKQAQARCESVLHNSVTKSTLFHK